MAANSLVRGESVGQKFNVFHAFINDLSIYKNEEEQMKNEGARVVTILYSYILDTQWQLTL